MAALTDKYLPLDYGLAEAIIVYPNPAVEFINIDLSKTRIYDKYTITLYNGQARKIMSLSNQKQIVTSKLSGESCIMPLTSC